ncbi:peptidase S41 [soil metagenome]
MKLTRSAVLVVLVSALACAALLHATASLADKQASPGRTEPSTEHRLADLAAFRTRFLAKDRSYTPAARTEAERRLAVLEGQAPTVSQPAFELELARIVALADNGHSHYVFHSISRYYNRVPLRLTVFGEDFYVLRAVAADADLLGARLTAIDGHPVSKLRPVVRSLWGGPAALRDRYAFELLESPELLNTLILAAAPGQAAYRFVTPAGRTIERSIAGDPPSAARPYGNPEQIMFPERLPLEDANWRTALAFDKAPWSLRAYPIRFRSRRAPELNAVVLELRQNSDANGFKIAQVLKQYESDIALAKPANLVVDLRFNGGGDLRTTRAFMQSLPSRVPGKVFVLTSPFTFSAAIASVGYLKQAAPDRVVIVGEEVGDRLNFFAEGDGVMLPNSQAMIGMGTQRHDYQTGCRPYKDCHSSVVRDPITIASLRPDIAAPWTIEAYLAGRDPALEAVAAALR